MTQQNTAAFPPQHQNHQPGVESEMNPLPTFDKPNYRGTGQLSNQTAIITGGDSGIGRAVACLFAREGANIVMVYLNEHDDAAVAKQAIEETGAQCLTLPGDIGDESFCRRVVDETLSRFGRLDILVNNAAYQQPQKSIVNITAEQLERTFRTNVFGMFFLTKAALPHMKQGASIINTASVTAYEGHQDLLDYSSTKGAIVAFTRSLSKSLVSQGIRVNGVAPGPIWTPLIPSTFEASQVAQFGTDTPMKRAGQPVEVAPCYLFLASHAASYMTGQILHVNGGAIVNG